VVVGFTAVVPDKATLPIALSMVTLVASVTDQLKLELPPGMMEEGLDEKELIMGAVGVVPPHPVANNKNIMAKNKLKYLKEFIF